jgi:hypothetical protein
LGGLLIISKLDEEVHLYKGKKMSNTVEQLKAAMEEFLSEDAKFAAGNNAAGTRARKALQEVGKAVKARRNEITEEKNARKEAKTAA